MLSKSKLFRPITQTSLSIIQVPDSDPRLFSNPSNNNPSGLCRHFNSNRQSQHSIRLLLLLPRRLAFSRNFNLSNSRNGASKIKSRILVPPSSRLLFSQHRVFKVKLRCSTNNQVSTKRHNLQKLVLLPSSRIRSDSPPNRSKTSQSPWALQASKWCRNRRWSSWHQIQFRILSINRPHSNLKAPTSRVLQPVRLKISSSRSDRPLLDSLPSSSKPSLPNQSSRCPCLSFKILEASRTKLCKPNSTKSRLRKKSRTPSKK